MSYIQLWNNTDVLLKSSHHNKAVLDSFVTLIQKRTEIEEEYARELQLLSDSCQKIIKREEER